MNGLPQFGPNPFLMYPPIPGAFPFYSPGMLSDNPLLFPMSHILANKMLSTWEQLKFKSYFDEQPLDLSVDRNKRESGGNFQEEYIDVVGVADKQHCGPLNLATSSVVRPIPLYPNLEIPTNIQSQPIKQQISLFNDNFQPSGLFKFVTKTFEEVAEVKPAKTTLQGPEVHKHTPQQTEIITNENKHYCKICDKRFTKAASLKRHLKIVHTTEHTAFKCPTCDRQFNTSLGLFRHNRSQHKVSVDLPETN